MGELHCGTLSKNYQKTTAQKTLAAAGKSRYLTFGLTHTYEVLHTLRNFLSSPNIDLPMRFVIVKSMVQVDTWNLNKLLFFGLHKSQVLTYKYSVLLTQSYTIIFW